ncbi:PaaY Carbonic anhydrases/acetyltransferases, isoleucine patch superfamily [actinobacterium SCGC AAA044-D11]
MRFLRGISTRNQEKVSVFSPNGWQVIESSANNIVVWGAGDQCSVNLPIIEELGLKIVAFIDSTIDLNSPIQNVPIFKSETDFIDWLSLCGLSNLGSVISIGNPYSQKRMEHSIHLAKLGIKPINIVDRTARVRKNVEYKHGLQVMPNVIVNNDVNIGSNCILNTASLIEHHCKLGDGVEIGPGAILTGRVTVNDHSWIGAGAVVLPRLIIGSNSIVGAGAVVTRDVPDNCVVVGSPARLLRSNIGNWL